MMLLEEAGILDRALRGPADQRGDRRAPPRRPRDGAARAGDPGRLLQAAARARAGALGLRRGAVAGARPARVLPARGRQALRPPAGRAPAAPPADLHGQLERGRQRARPDVRVAAGGRARRRAGRRRARVPDRARGDRRRRALGGRRAARGRRPRGAARADGRRRRAGRGDHALVSDLGAGGRHRGDDRGRPRRLRAARRGARRARLRRAPAPARADRRAAARRGRPGAAGARPRAAARSCATRPDMVWVAGATGRPIEEVAEVFFAVGAELRLDWIEGELERVPAPTRMQRWALQAVREDAAQVRRELAGCVLAESTGGPPPRPSRRSWPSAAPRCAASRRSCAPSRARASRTSPGSRWPCASCARSSTSTSRPRPGRARPARGRRREVLVEPLRVGHHRVEVLPDPVVADAAVLAAQGRALS